MPLRLPHEVLCKCCLREPDVWRIGSHDPSEWQVPSFTDHPITQARGIENTKPIGCYTDKVVLHENDGFYRLSVGLTWRRSRHTCFSVLSSMMCQCGCNGHCTLDVVQVITIWSLNCCQRGFEPVCRHDGSPWGPRDVERAARSGRALPMGFCAVTEYRADWPERAAASGIKNHSGDRPCM